MRLAFSTLGCPGWDRLRVIDEAVRLGFDGIEWRLADGRIIDAGFAEDLAADLGERVAAAGLAVPALDSSIDLAVPPGEQRRQILDETKRMLGLAARFRAEYLRVFPGAHAPEAGAARWLREAVEALAPAVAESGVRLALELHDSRNDPGIRGQSCSRFMAEALDGTTTAVAGVQWDIGNPYLEGEPADETWRNIAGRLLYLQFKDMARQPDGTWRYVLTGDGDLPLHDILDSVGGKDFAGWVSFEWEKYWNPEIPEPEIAFPGFIDFMRVYR